jgi:hypothetical protein
MSISTVIMMNLIAAGRGDALAGERSPAAAGASLGRLKDHSMR